MKPVPPHLASLIEEINLGNPLYGDGGDTWRAAFEKCNRNFVTLLAVHAELLDEVAALRKRVKRLEADG